MTGPEKLTVAAAVAGALVALAWAGGQFSVHADAELGTGQDTPGEDDQAGIAGRIGRGHLCGDVPGAVSDRHPLYRRHDGHAMRKALTGGGWEWFLNPPSEAAL